MIDGIGLSTAEMGINVEQEDKDNHRDVLFFDSPYHTDQELSYSLIKDSGQNMDLPRGMLSIASHLKEQGVSSDVIPLDAHLYPNREMLMTNGEFDQEKYKKAIENLVDSKIEKASPNTIAFGLMYTFTEPIVLEMTRYAKEKFPDKKVVVGGNHATFNDLELLDPENKTGIDIVVRFEGELTMSELMSEIGQPNPDLSKIPGISYRDENGQVHQNPPRDRADLYELPPLDYSLIDSPESLDKFNQTAMFLRGCKGNCAFCTSPNYWKRQITEGTQSNFEQEIEYLAQNGIEVVGLLDDDILASSEAFERIVESLREVHEKYPNLKFIAQTRVIHLKDSDQCANILAEMKEVGIKRLYLGIESGSQEILGEMSKGYRVEWVEQALKNARNAGLETGGFWLFGHPGATPEREEESIAFMEKLLQQGLLDDVEAHAVVPLPGTRVAADNRINVFDDNKKHYGILSNYPVYDLVNPESGEVTLSADEINGFLHRALELRKKYLGVEEGVANKAVE